MPRPDTMRAMILPEFGAPLRPATVPVPKLGPNDVLRRVRDRRWSHRAVTNAIGRCRFAGSCTPGGPHRATHTAADDGPGHRDREVADAAHRRPRARDRARAAPALDTRW